MQAAPRYDREFGLDWLRIGAFALLIFYHIGMFFAPWGWHVQTAAPIEWVTWPMMAVNPWRLSLLFVISGMVSRSLLAKLGSPGAFAGSRSFRLLIPLAAGMVIFVSPQPWAELRDRGAYSDGFLHFWLHDYAEFGASRGTPLPTWNHLWFVAYLWAYSVILAALAWLPARARRTLQLVFDRSLGGWRLFFLPFAWLMFARLVLLPRFGETHALFDDPYAHAVYAFAFFFGVGLARSASARETIRRWWKVALVVASVAFLSLFSLQLSGADPQIAMPLRAATRAALAWAAILGLIGMAQAHLHSDGPARRYLTEAIFPYYIAHQTIIVLFGFWLKQAGVSPGLQFWGILSATVIGCALTYEIARRVNWLRPLFGLRWRSAAERRDAARPAQASI